jgi:hydrogenase nickel incorporation protein HypA/HybF
MEIGPLSGVVIDSFQFGFDTLTASDILLGKAQLVIKTTNALYHCSGCGYEIVTNDSRPDQCLQCGDRLLIPKGGDELILRQVEME